MEPVCGVLEADRRRRFRSLAVGFPDAGLGRDQPRLAMDDRAPDGVYSSSVDPGKSARRACRLLPRQQIPEDHRHRRDGRPSDPLLHRGVRAVGRVRLPVAGAADHRRLADEPAMGLEYDVHPERAAALDPAGYFACPGWHRRMVHGHAFTSLQHRDRGLCNLCGACGCEPPAHSVRIRDAQRAGAAGDWACDVARIDLQRRHHHRAGVRLPGYRHTADFRRAYRRLQPRHRHRSGVDHRGVGLRAGDRSPLSAARPAREGQLTMLTIFRDLFRYNREFRIGALLTGFIVFFAALSLVSPYPPQDVYIVPPDLPPSPTYWFGTTSRGQDVFWQLTFAIRNTMLFGFAVALLSRLLSIAIGMWSGYKGGIVDRVLMSINDTFIVIPL